MDESTIHVLFLGSARFMQRAFTSRQGVRTSLIAPNERPADQGHLVYRKAANPTDMREAALAIHARHPVTHLACFDDRFQDLAAEVAERLNLPFHPSATVTAVQHKGRMRARLADAGLDDTPYRLVNTEAELRQFIAAVGYPVVLKPVSGLGSEGIGVIDTDATLASQWQRTRLVAPQGELMAEQFLQGEEFSVEGFTHRGQHTLLAITGKHVDPTTKVEISHHLPADLPRQVSLNIREFVDRALTALQVGFGPTHTEIIVTPNGPRLLETHLRPGGGFIPELIQDIGGPNIFELTAKQVFGQIDGKDLDQLRTFECGQSEKFAAVYFRFALPGQLTPSVVGRFRGMENLERVRSLPGVTTAGATVSPGATVRAAQASKDWLAYGRVVGPTAGLAVQRAATAANALELLIELHPTTVDQQPVEPEVVM